DQSLRHGDAHRRDGIFAEGHPLRLSHGRVGHSVHGVGPGATAPSGLRRDLLTAAHGLIVGVGEPASDSLSDHYAAAVPREALDPVGGAPITPWRAAGRPWTTRL